MLEALECVYSIKEAELYMKRLGDLMGTAFEEEEENDEPICCFTAADVLKIMEGGK